MQQYFWSALADRDDVNESLESKGLKSFRNIKNRVKRKFPI